MCIVYHSSCTALKWSSLPGGTSELNNDYFPHQVARDMEQQRAAVDVALQIRIDETRDAKAKLEGHLAEVRKHSQRRGNTCSDWEWV